MRDIVMFIIVCLIITAIGLGALLSIPERRIRDMQEQQCHGHECLEIGGQ